MPALPALRQKAVEAIGEALSKQDIVRLVKAATGNDIFNIYADENDPRAVAVSKTLAQLEKEGKERWLLTYVLIAIAEQKLRTLIVKTWPNTLVGLPQAGGQVDNALKYLRTVFIPLSIDLRQELKERHASFDEIRQRIAELYVYKSLHELLHVLNVKLVVAGSAPGTGTDDFAAILQQCDTIAAQAPAAVALLEKQAIELAWISQLAGLAASLKSAMQGSDTAACLSARNAIQSMVRLHLARLNTLIFNSANDLPFEALVYGYPLDIETKDQFDDLVFAVRDLKPTVIARALKQSMWQEAENEITLIADFFNVASDEFSGFSEHWFPLKSRVLWLANLDPDDAWAKQAQQFSDEIEDGLSREKLDDEVKHRFEAFRNLFRFRFLAIDNTLKQDCSSLRMIDAPLTEILKELAP